MRLLIVEDEPLIAERLERYCREILGDTLLSLRREDEYDEAGAWVATNPVDLLLLDLNLRGSDGMQLLESSVSGSFHTIIVSANTDQALRAFEYGVLDFVPKPFSRERLAQALRRCSSVAGTGPRAARKLAVRKQGRVEVMPVDDVLYVKGADNYAELVLRDGRRALHDKSLERLSELLPDDFERIHKSYLVRRSVIKALHASEGSYVEVELSSGERLPVGRTRYRALREKLLQ